MKVKELIRKLQDENQEGEIVFERWQMALIDGGAKQKVKVWEPIQGVASFSRQRFPKVTILS